MNRSAKQFFVLALPILCLLMVAAQPIAAQAADPAPPVSISLGGRQAQVTPIRQGFNHTGGGNIDVAQPSPDTIVITMTGVAVAGAEPCKNSVGSLQFNLSQCFTVSIDNPQIKRAKLSIAGRVIGVLRSQHDGGGAAQEGPGCAAICNEAEQLVTICVPVHGVKCGESLSVNDATDTLEVPVAAGKFTLNQNFTVSATNPARLLPCKAASSEFAPDPALDPLWISYWEPFHGATKKDFGFQVTVKVVPDSEEVPPGKPTNVAPPQKQAREPAAGGPTISAVRWRGK